MIRNRDLNSVHKTAVSSRCRHFIPCRRQQETSDSKITFGLIVHTSHDPCFSFQLTNRYRTPGHGPGDTRTRTVTHLHSHRYEVMSKLITSHCVPV